MDFWSVRPSHGGAGCVVRASSENQAIEKAVELSLVDKNLEFSLGFLAADRLVTVHKYVFDPPLHFPAKPETIWNKLKRAAARWKSN